MTRKVDRAKETRRQQSLASILVAQNNLLLMVDKCAELEGLSRAQVGGHPRGEPIIKRADQSRQVLKGALSALAQARQACHLIDVTVEVPDQEVSHG